MGKGPLALNRNTEALSRLDEIAGVAKPGDSDEASVEAMEFAYHNEIGGGLMPMRAALAAVAPLIRRAAIVEAARVAHEAALDHVEEGGDIWVATKIEEAIRAICPDSKEPAP